MLFVMLPRVLVLLVSSNSSSGIAVYEREAK